MFAKLVILAIGHDFVSLKTELKPTLKIEYTEIQTQS